MARQLAALRRIRGIAEDLCDVRVERHAAEQPDPGLAQRRHDPVVRLAGGGRADHGGLLAHRLAVEPDAALALQRHHPGVGDADPQHALEQAAGELAGQAAERTVFDRGAVLADELEQPARLGLVVAVEVAARHYTISMNIEVGSSSSDLTSWTNIAPSQPSASRWSTEIDRFIRWRATI